MGVVRQVAEKVKNVLKRKNKREEQAQPSASASNSNSNANFNKFYNETVNSKTTQLATGNTPNTAEQVKNAVAPQQPANTPLNVKTGRSKDNSNNQIQNETRTIQQTSNEQPAQRIDLTKDQKAREYVRQGVRQGEVLAGPPMLVQRRTAGDIVRENNYREEYPNYGPQYEIKEEYDPTTKMMLAIENKSRYKREYLTEEQIREIENAKLLAAWKASEQAYREKTGYSGYEVPGGVQGIFTRASRGFDKVTDFVETKILPTEQELRIIENTQAGDLLINSRLHNAPLLRATGDLLFNPDFVGQGGRREVLNVGSYFVPYYGEAKFMADIGKLGEQGRYGEAAIIGGVPIVAKVASVQIPQIIQARNKAKVLRELEAKYKGALSTQVSPDDLVRAREAGVNVVVRGREVKSVSFYTLENPGSGRLSNYKFAYGKETTIPKNQLETADFYTLHYKGVKGGLPNNLENLPAKLGENNYLTDSFKGSMNVNKKVAESLFVSNNLQRFDPARIVHSPRFVIGEGTFVPQKFSTTGEVVATGAKKAKFKPRALLSRSKPLTNFQAGNIVEKNSFKYRTEPADTLQEAALNAENLDWGITIKPAKLTKLANAPSKPRVFRIDQVLEKTDDAGKVVSSSGGAQQSVMRVVEAKVETLLKKKPKIVYTIAQAKATNMPAVDFQYQEYKMGSVQNEIRPDPQKAFTKSVQDSKPVTSTNNVKSAQSDLRLFLAAKKKSNTALKNPQVVSPAFQPVIDTIAKQPQKQPQKQPVSYVFKQKFDLARKLRFDVAKDVKSTTRAILRSEPVKPTPIKVVFDKKKKSEEEGEELLSADSFNGFQAFLKVKGKYKVISPITTEKAALDIGVVFAKTTLGATFTIKAVKGELVNVKTKGEFERYRNEFRDYMVRQGKPVALSNTYIQKEKYRLGTMQEREAIQKAKKKKFSFI